MSRLDQNLNSTPRSSMSGLRRPLQTLLLYRTGSQDLVKSQEHISV